MAGRAPPRRAPSSPAPAETPGGLKIQTVHAFCEKLLRRFPLEAGVSPGFKVLDDVAAAEVSARAREEVAALAMARAGGSGRSRLCAFFGGAPLGRVQRHVRRLRGPPRRRSPPMSKPASGRAATSRHAWRLCGFNQPTSLEEIEADALSGLRFRWSDWKRATEALLESDSVRDQELGAAMRAVSLASSFAAVSAPFFTNMGEPRAQLGTNGVDRRAKALARRGTGAPHRDAPTPGGRHRRPRHGPRPHPGPRLRCALRRREVGARGAGLQRPDRPGCRPAGRPKHWRRGR